MRRGGGGGGVGRGEGVSDTQRGLKPGHIFVVVFSVICLRLK